MKGKTSGAVLFDVDGDGILDILLGRHGQRPQAFRNTGNLKFQLIADWGSHIDVRDHHATLVADFDSDETHDLYLVSGSDRGEGAGNNSLYLSTDDYLTDKAGKWGIPDFFGRGRGAVALDLHRDSVIDLLVLNYKTPMRAFRLASHEPGQDYVEDLFGLPPADDVSVAKAFENGKPSAELRYRSEYIHSLSPQDLDNDGDIDFITFGSPPVLILRSTEGRYYSDVPLLPQGAYLPAPVSGVWGDFDNDGKPDLYLVYGSLDRQPLVGGTRLNRLLLGRNGEFVDVTDSVTALGGVGTNCAAADLDNNGALDLLILQSDRGAHRTWHQVLLNKGNECFLPPSGSLISESRDGLPDGILTADLDNDGDIDVLELLGAIGAERPGGGVRLFRNDLSSGNWLSIQLESRENISLYGSRVEVSVGLQKWIRQYWPYQVAGSAYPAVLHFGLGQANKVNQITITWPSGNATTLCNVKANQQLTIQGP
jgi:hypothetical protein